MSDWHAFLESVPTERCTTGNRMTHLPDDNKTIYALWDALEAAEKRIWVTMYTLVPDAVGRGTLERMTAAARWGCDVLLLCDYVGSFSLRENHLAPLRQAGGQVAFFNPPWPLPKQWNGLLTRDHRKLIIVDDNAAFCGGMNLSEKYAGRDFGNWVFDDTMARVEGPCVYDLADVFRHTWREETGQNPALPPRAAAHPKGFPVAVLEVDPRRPETRLAHVLGAAIRQAENYCYIATPYFIPPDWLHDALLDAARRGVEVRVVTAGDTDRAIARLAGWHCYGELITAGIRVYEMFGRILHSKTLTIDGCFGSIGSFNMDAWTSRHVLDLNMIFADETVAASLEEEFFLHLDNAREITTDACGQRGALSRLAHQFTYHAYRRL